jgi:hypothetical protein
MSGNSETFPAEPLSERSARQFVDEWLTARRLASPGASHVVSELATNAIHAHRPFTVSLTRSVGAIRLELSTAAAGSGASEVPRPSSFSHLMVGLASREWGAAVDGDRAVVWAEIPAGLVGRAHPADHGDTRRSRRTARSAASGHKVDPTVEPVVAAEPVAPDVTSPGDEHHPSAFEAELLRVARQVAPRWAVERTAKVNDVDHRTNRIAKNARAVAEFLAAMDAAACVPERRTVLLRTGMNRRHHRRRIQGWTFSVDGASYFVTTKGDVYASKTREDGRTHRIQHLCEPADPGGMFFRVGLLRRYRAATAREPQQGRSPEAPAGVIDISDPALAAAAAVEGAPTTGIDVRPSFAGAD